MCRRNLALTSTDVYLKSSALKTVAKVFEMIKLARFCHSLVSLKYTTQEEHDAAMTYIIQQYENFGWNNKKSSSLLLLHKPETQESFKI